MYEWIFWMKSKIDWDLDVNLKPCRALRLIYRIAIKLEFTIKLRKVSMDESNLKHELAN